MGKDRRDNSNGHGQESIESGDSLSFRPSASNTLGVELELQIIEPETGDLAPGAVRILNICQEVGLASVSAELMQSMIEVKTGVCRNVQEVDAELRPTLRRLRNVVSSLGFQLGFGGTHPFHRGLTSAVFPDARVKIFLVAPPAVRAERRLRQRGQAVDEAVLAQETARIAARDHADSTRLAAPLIAASDAIQLDTSGLSFDQQVDRIVALVEASPLSQALGGR